MPAGKVEDCHPVIAFKKYSHFNEHKKFFAFAF